jgi:hypothetical protein
MWDRLPAAMHGLSGPRTSFYLSGNHLIDSVIPAQAGIQAFFPLDSCLRRNDSKQTKTPSKFKESPQQSLTRRRVCVLLNFRKPIAFYGDTF